MITCHDKTQDTIWQDMVFNDDVTPSETNVQCFSNPGEESAKGEDATENGCSQGKHVFSCHIRFMWRNMNRDSDSFCTGRGLDNAARHAWIGSFAQVWYKWDRWLLIFGKFV